MVSRVHDDEQAQRIDDLLANLRSTIDEIARNGRQLTGNSLLDKAKLEYKRRRRREAIFPMQIFGEPAWDLLLDLYISECSNKKISVKSACIASSVPNSTAIRWINYLVELQFITREKSANDARVVYLKLTDEAMAHIEQYLSGL